jgi:hypothetical protein
VPPGVHPSADGAEVTSPVSIMEWFMNLYSACNTWEKREFWSYFKENLRNGLRHKIFLNLTPYMIDEGVMLIHIV